MATPATTADVQVGQLFRDATGLLVVFEVYDDQDWVDAMDTDGHVVPFDGFQELLDDKVLDWEVI